MIQCCGIKKTFSSSEGIKGILSPFSFSFSPGHIYLIKGATGSGKSTLLSLVGLLAAPEEGEILINQVNYQKETKKAREDYISRNISHLFPNLPLLPELTVLQNLLCMTKDLDKIESLLKEANVYSLRNKKFHHLSKGEKARIGILRVILEDKSIVLMDEPTANLDQETAQFFFSLMYRYLHQKIVLIVSHAHDILLPFPFIELHIDNGKITAQNDSLDAKKTIETILQKETTIKRKFPFFALSFTSFCQTKIKYLLLFVTQIALFICSLSTMALLDFDANQKIRTQLNGTGIQYIQETESIQSFDYRMAKLKILKDETLVDLTCIYNPSNTFYFQNQEFTVGKDQLFLPDFQFAASNLIEDEWVTIETLPIQVKKSYTVEIVDYLQKISATSAIEPSFSTILDKTLPCFIDYQFIQKLFYANPVYVDANTFKNLTDALWGSAISGLRYNKIKMASVFTLETKLYLPLYLKTEEQNIRDSILGKTFPLLPPSFPNSFPIEKYMDEIKIDQILFTEEQISSLPIIELSSLVTAEIQSSFFSSGYGAEIPYLISHHFFDQTDFDIHKIESFGVLSSNDLQLYNTLETFSIYIWIAQMILLALHLILLLFLIDGLFSYFKKRLLYLYTIAVSKNKRYQLFVCQSLFWFFLSFVSSLGVFSYIASMWNGMIFHDFKLYFFHSVFHFSPYLLLYVFALLVFIGIHSYRKMNLSNHDFFAEWKKTSID